MGFSEASTEAVTTQPLLSQWNTSKLGLRAGTDAASAATAAGLVAPLICSIDRAVISKVASGTSLSSCLVTALREPLLRPHKFVISKPFLLIFSIYFSTYFAANTVDTLTATLNPKPESTFSSTTAGPAKFAATSTVNMTLSVVKDSQFARMFGQASTAASTGPAATIPRITYALFMFRDSLTIFASFNLPPLIAPQLQHLPPAVKSRFSRFLSTESGRTNTAQFLTPAAMQIFSTPVHLLGLDLYNRQGNLGFASRTSRVLRDWGVAATARMGRIIPAFGVGGVVNASMRRDLMHKLEEGEEMRAC